MSYTHKLVSSVTSSLRTTIPHYSIQALVNNLSKKQPHLKFSFETPDHAHVYVDGEIYTRGMVHLETVHNRRVGSSEVKFAVYSRTIHNHRYNDYSREHFTKVTKNMSLALKTAVNNLPPYSLGEIARLSHRAIARHVADAHGDVSRKTQNALRNMGFNPYDTGSRALKEMCNMYLSGHRFIDTDLQRYMDEYFESRAEEDERAKLGNDLIYVMIWDKPDGRTYGLSKTEKKDGNVRVFTDEYSSWVTDNELPDNVRERLSVLSMCAVDQHVDGVGGRISEREFFLEL